MADLKKLYSALGFKNVTTYIQSGNVLFEAVEKQDKNALAAKIEKAIDERFGYDVPVIIRTPEELKHIIICQFISGKKRRRKKN